MTEEKQKDEVGMEKDWESGLRFKKCCLYCILSNLLFGDFDLSNEMCGLCMESKMLATGYYWLVI